VFDVESNGGKPCKLSAEYRQLVRELRPEHWGYMRSMPYTLELPQHAVLVVHAGLQPGLPLRGQDPHTMTHIRSLDEHGKPSSHLGSRSWAADYVGPPHVVFGHSAQRGIQLLEHATGLDSGCVYGKCLTALVLEENEPVPPVAQRRRSLVSVPARKVHFMPRSS